MLSNLKIKLGKYNKILKNFNKIFNAIVRTHKLSFQSSKSAHIGLYIVVIIISVLPFVNSFLSGKVIDSLIQTVNNPNNLNAFLYIVIIYIVFLSSEIIISTIRSYFDTINFIEFEKFITTLLFKTFSKIDIAHYENAKTNDDIQKAKDSYEYRLHNVLNYSQYTISSLISVISGFTVLLYLSPFILIIIIFSSLPSFFTNIIFGKKKYGLWDEDADIRRNYWDTQNYLIDENSLKELKIFNLHEKILNNITNILTNFQDRQKQIEIKRTIFSGFLSIISALGFGLSYWLLAHKAILGGITIGEFTFYVGTIRLTSSSISSILNNFSSLYENSLYTLDVFKILDLKPIIKSGNVIINNTKPPIIEFKNVDFSYPSNKELVYKNLNFKIKPGEKIAIVGQNGAGKTTLIKILSRFYDVTKGELLINGTNIKEIDINSWYSNLAILSQEFVKFHYDAKTNISLGNYKDYNFDKVIESSKLSGAHEFINEYKNKYDQILNKRYQNGIDPSTGQWQKIALSRAFYKDAPILILDEPTSAIDPKAEFEIFDKLFDYAKDKTVIIISHRFSTVRNADRIIVIDDGKIIEEGTHKELVELNGIYKEAYDLQKKGYEDI